MVGFVSDYLASSAVVDELMQAAHSPCIHCSFRVLEGPEMDILSVYAHSTNMHSANTSSSLGIMKTEALGVPGIGKNDCNLIVMQAGNASAQFTLDLYVHCFGFGSKRLLGLQIFSVPPLLQCTYLILTHGMWLPPTTLSPL